MTPFQNVLVGIDLSHGERLVSTELTLPNKEAVERALWCGSLGPGRKVTFAAVLDLGDKTLHLLQEDHDLQRDVDVLAKQVLDALQAQAQKLGVQAADKVLFGKASVELTKEVIRGGHDGLIVGTRDLTGLQHYLFGSTAQKLLRTCPCPVWVTKPSPDEKVQRILAATELGDVGQACIRTAAELARATGAELHVVHAMETPEMQILLHRHSASDDLQTRMASIRGGVERDLDAQLDIPEVQALAAKPRRHLVESSSEQAILQVVREQKIDLIVMGTAARSGLEGWMLGNTAERLLAQLSCSLVALKPAGFQSPVSV